MESRSLSHLPPGEPKSCGVMLHIIGNTDKAAAEKAAAVKAAAEKAAAVKIAAIMATADKAAADKAAADKAAADKAAADKAAADKAAKENDAGEKATGSKETGSPSKVLTSMPEEEEEDDEWDNFSKTEMKVLIKEVELRKEALFGDYKEGESPKYRWLIWQEVAEKVNEVNPCIHRNLEQVRIKWFDYKDPTNKWERRVKKKAYKHTTGMFFKRRTNSLATCPAGDSDGDQSSAENKNVDKANDPQGKPAGEEGKSGPAPQSTSQQGKFAQVDEATKVKGVLSTLNADKAKRAIRYLSHLSQRHGMAMVQPKSAPKEASPNQSHSIEEVTVVEDDEPEKEAASDRKKPEDETESVINPPKKTYSRPRSDPAMGALKLVLGGDSDAVNSCALLKTRGGMYSCDQKEADLVSPKDPNTASGVKRPAKGMDVASTPESKRMMFGSSGSNVAALLKTVDPSKVQQIHMKHPKTGKDMVVTKISAPEAMVALGNKISRVKLLNEDSKSNPSAESKKATLSPTTAKPSPNPAANLAVDSNTIAVGQQIVTGQKVITNAKVLGAKDSKGSFPLLVPVGAIKQVTNSSNLLIKHPVTGKGIIISKVLQAPLTSAAPVKPTVTTVAAPIGLAPTVGSRDSTGKAVVPGGGKLISGLPLVNVVTTIQPSTSTSSVVTVSKNQDVDSCSEKLKTSELASPESLDVTVKKSLDGTKMESNSDASAVGGESAMETDCESTVVVGEESSGMLDLPDGNEEEATLAPSRENTVEMKADNSGLGETIQPTVFNMENKGKQVTKSSSTVALGDTAINKSPIQEVINDLFPKMKDPGMSDVGSQEVDARLFEEKKSAVTVPTTVAKSQPTAEKEEKVSETKFLQTVKTSVAGVLKPLPLQTEDLAQQILRGVGGSMKISAQGQASGSMPAKWESGGVRMLNIGGKTVKVVLVKDEDYCKMMGKSKVSVIKPSQSVMTVVPDVEEKPHKDMPLIEILNKQSETVGKVGGKMGPGDVVKNSPNQGTAVDASSKAIQATPIQGHTPSTPVKEHKAILGFPPSPTSAPMGILGTPVGNLLTTSTTSSPSMTVVTMPQRVVSMDCPQNPVIKAGLRKPNILSSSTRTVASSSGMISVVAGSSPSNFGVKRALPTSIQATTSKLKVRVVKDEGMCKELEKTQHPLVKAALSGKPIDFQEELKKLDSLEDTTRSEVGDFAEGKDVSGVPARNVSQDKKDNAIGDKNRKNPLSEPGNPPETGVSPSVTSDHAYIGVKTGAPKDKPLLNISGPSPSGGSIRVRSTESLQNIRIASNVVSKKISLSHIAVLNSGSPRGPLNALGVRNDQASIVSRGKRKQELVVNKLSVGAKVARNFKSGLVRNPTNMEVMRDVDDCVIVEEVITRSMDPPEVFCVDSNDSYGVEVS